MTMHQDLLRLVSLESRVACVTGAAQGIGRAAAERLAQAGASVLLTDLKQSELSATVQAIQSSGGRAEGLVADAGRIDDADRVMRFAVERFGGIDILVNNAAAFTTASVLDMTPEEWRRVFAVDLDGAFFHAQAAARRMIEGGRGGRIISISSQSYLVPPPNLSAYATAKGAVVAMTRALARELGQHNITVNAISPGVIITPGSEEQRARMREVGAYREAGAPPRSVLGRAGVADDIANSIFFLASEMGAFVTGEVIAVDGGYALI